MNRLQFFIFILLLPVTRCFADDLPDDTRITRVDDICYLVNLDKMIARVIDPVIFNGSKKEYVGDIIIPEEIEPYIVGYKFQVTEIAQEAFQNDVTTSVVIPKTIKTIPSGCFTHCSNLISVTFHYGLKEIGYGAFAALPRLEKVVFKNDAVAYDGRCAIGKDAFRECRNLKSVYMGSCVKSIGVNAFSDCSALTSVTMGKGLNVIDYEAFMNCSSLTSINIPSSVTYIGEYAFGQCWNLSAVHITDLSAWCNIHFANWLSNPLNYAHHIYMNNNEINNLVISNDVTSIKPFAFIGFWGLLSVTIPNSVTSIGDYAFSDCRSLTAVTIPESTVSIGKSAFSDCENLASVYIPKGVTSISIGAFCGCSSLSSITIPEGVTTIDEDTFSGCSALTSINIPSSVTSIGERAFNNCSSLEAVHITDLSAWCKILYASEDAGDVFYAKMTWGNLECTCQPLYYAHHLYLNNQLLTDLVVPEDVTSISSLAFSGCSDLTSVTIPGNVKSIGKGAFYDCKRLTKIIVPDIAAWCEISFDRPVDNPIYLIGRFYSDTETEITNLVIPEGTTRIGNHAFPCCIDLTSATIPEGVTDIGMSSFSGCINLTSVTLPESLARIDSFAFSGCALTDIKIPRSTASIGKQAFVGCNLTDITIPKNLTSIGFGAFGDCNLTSITVEEDNPIFDSRDGCNAIIETATNTLILGCSNTIIPPSITCIDNAAFSCCSGLTSIIIPDGVTKIGNGAFSGCSSLNNVYCCATEPPIAAYNFGWNGWNNFYYSFDISHIEEHTTLHVPESSLESYRTTAPWSNFKNIVALTEDEIDSIGSLITDSFPRRGEKYHDLNGRKLSAPQRGINIIRYSDGTSKEVLIK